MFHPKMSATGTSPSGKTSDISVMSKSCSDSTSLLNTQLRIYTSISANMSGSGSKRSNIALLTEGQSYIQRAKKARREQITEIKFDDDARRCACSQGLDSDSADLCAENGCRGSRSGKRPKRMSGWRGRRSETTRLIWRNAERCAYSCEITMAAELIDPLG